jgi:D-erythro-7,8-dihydroneopterin triphosphate epimerase
MEEIPLDRIRIQELKARTFVGFNDWEREKKQDVAISVTLHADLRSACESDRVDDTVDYKTIKNRILSLVEGSRFLLIEAMAERIAAVCLEDPKVVRVDVLVDKLSALRFAKSVQVEITRAREPGAAPSDQ